MSEFASKLGGHLIFDVAIPIGLMVAYTCSYRHYYPLKDKGMKSLQRGQENTFVQIYNSVNLLFLVIQVARYLACRQIKIELLVVTVSKILSIRNFVCRSSSIYYLQRIKGVSMIIIISNSTTLHSPVNPNNVLSSSHILSQQDIRYLAISFLVLCYYHIKLLTQGLGHQKQSPKSLV